MTGALAGGGLLIALKAFAQSVGRRIRGREQQRGGGAEPSAEESVRTGWLDLDAKAPPRPLGGQLFPQRILRGWFITSEYSCDRRRRQNPPPAPSSNK